MQMCFVRYHPRVLFHGNLLWPSCKSLCTYLLFNIFHDILYYTAIILDIRSGSRQWYLQRGVRGLSSALLRLVKKVL